LPQKGTSKTDQEWGGGNPGGAKDVRISGGGGGFLDKIECSIKVDLII